MEAMAEVVTTTLHCRACAQIAASPFQPCSHCGGTEFEEVSAFLNACDAEDMPNMGLIDRNKPEDMDNMQLVMAGIAHLLEWAQAEAPAGGHTNTPLYAELKKRVDAASPFAQRPDSAEKKLSRRRGLPANQD